MGGQSGSTKFRHDVAWSIVLNTKMVFINELIPKQPVSLQNHGSGWFVPSLVVLYMLEFLRYRHVDTRRAQTALTNLQVLVHHDQEQHVPVKSKDILWQILGICQQISGELQVALYFYKQSLLQCSYHRTLMRIHGPG
jgi:hypothetical protein